LWWFGRWNDETNEKHGIIFLKFAHSHTTYPIVECKESQPFINKPIYRKTQKIPTVGDPCNFPTLEAISHTHNLNVNYKQVVLAGITMVTQVVKIFIF